MFCLLGVPTPHNPPFCHCLPLTAVLEKEKEKKNLLPSLWHEPLLRLNQLMLLSVAMETVRVRMLLWKRSDCSLPPTATFHTPLSTHSQTHERTYTLFHTDPWNPQKVWPCIVSVMFILDMVYDFIFNSERQRHLFYACINRGQSALA